MVILAGLLGALGGDAVAHADPAGARAEARALARMGDVRFYEGRCDQAIPLWKRADAAYHTPTIVLRIARCQVLFGKVVAAAATLESIVGEPLAPEASPAFVAAREEARRELLDVRARVAELRVVVPGARAPAALTVEIDGVVEPRGMTTFRLDPGLHVVVVRAGAVLSRRTVELAAGDRLTHNVTLSPDPESSPGLLAQRGIGVAALSVGGAALVTGVCLAVLAGVTSRRVDEACGAGGADCPAAQAEIARVRALSTGAGAAFAGGAGLVLAGTVALATAARQPGAARGVRFVASPGAASLALDF